MVDKVTSSDGGETALPASPEGRVARRQRQNRARLLEAAYEEMAVVGVDNAKIKDITDRADLGFGTFYNYFESKDDLAAQVLDCMICDYGRRNRVATNDIEPRNAAKVMCISMRLVIREAARLPIWQWWALRPDLLADRMRDGFGPFALSDMREGIDSGLFDLEIGEMESAWALATWIIVGGIHDIVVGERAVESDVFAARSVMQVFGLDKELARQVSSIPLPEYGTSEIDWSFRLEKPSRAATES